MPSRRSFLGAAALAAAAQPKQPNFLFLLPDQWRPDWLPGNPKIPIKLPHIQALAARGMRFHKVLCASPLCAPSRACLATGREYKNANVATNQFDFPLDQKTYYQSLQKAGYHTMACGKVDLHKKTLDWGLDGQRLLKEWGFSAGIDNAGKGDAVRSGALAPESAGPRRYGNCRCDSFAGSHNRGVAHHRECARRVATQALHLRVAG